MTQEQYKGYFQNMRMDYPGVKEIKIFYYGSGDSFEDWNIEEVDGEYSDKCNNFTEKYTDLLDQALEHSDANFNDDGCDGYITVNIENETLTIDNYYKEEVYTPSGIIRLNVVTATGPTLIEQHIELQRQLENDDQIIK